LHKYIPKGALAEQLVHRVCQIMSLRFISCYIHSRYPMPLALRSGFVRMLPLQFCTKKCKIDFVTPTALALDIGRE
jgi:hypothetical protein